MTTTQEKLEYIDFKLDDEGIEGVAERCLEELSEFDPALAVRLEEWKQDADRLFFDIRDLLIQQGIRE